MYIEYSEPLQKRISTGFFRLKKQLSVNENRGFLTEGTVVTIELRKDFDYNGDRCYNLKLYVVEKTEYPDLYCLSSKPIYSTFTSSSPNSDDLQWFDEYFEQAEECNIIREKYDAVQDSMDNRQIKSTLIIGTLAIVNTLIFCGYITNCSNIFAVLMVTAFVAATLICYYIKRAECDKCNELYEQFQIALGDS